MGVEYIQQGQIKRAYADQEVILCGGAINSPQMLVPERGEPNTKIGLIAISVELSDMGASE